MADINIPTGPIEAEPYDAILTSPGESLSAACRTALLRELGGMEFGTYDDTILAWLADWEPSTVATVCSWLRRVRATPPNASPTVPSKPAPATTSVILRSAAQIMQTQTAHVSAVTAIRIAAGAGREAHEQAEAVLSWLAEHLEYDTPSDLEHWERFYPREQVLARLGSAADVAEQPEGGER